MEEIDQKLVDVVLKSNEGEDIVVTDSVERRVKERQSKRKGALVFCVACGAINRTLRKWHNSYLCTDCFKIAQNVGDEKFIKALQGKET